MPPFRRGFPSSRSLSSQMPVPFSRCYRMRLTISHQKHSAGPSPLLQKRPQVPILSGAPNSHDDETGASLVIRFRRRAAYAGRLAK
jgi:hypothetical protein